MVLTLKKLGEGKGLPPKTGCERREVDAMFCAPCDGELS